LLGAIEKEDLELLENILCDDADLIFFGTDANERWVGKKALIAAHKVFFRAKSDSKMEIYNKTIHISLSGTVAWTSCMMNWAIKSGDQPLNLEGLRLTMVFEKRDNKWVAVQTHGSLPPSGQSIEY
jgi:ketosteroid isomerase-like protein